jgi:hypothetical protein
MGVEPLVAALMGTVAITLVLMFLPAGLELAHPKDPGPRLINDNVTPVSVVLLTNIEQAQYSDSNIPSCLASVLQYIPNLEL